MSASILSGRILRDMLVPQLTERVNKLAFVPVVAIIQVGQRPDSTSFIKAKKFFAQKIGLTVNHIQLLEDVSEEDLILQIVECNDNPQIKAIIVQLPLPSHINRERVIEAIKPEKDADGLTKNARVMPATARGIQELLRFYNISLNKKKVTVIGRSLLVGIPVADMCRKAGALVTVCHRGTPEIVKEIFSADVLIVAAGSAHLIRAEQVREGQIIIDVGINSKLDKTVVGDVDFEAVKDVVAAITPVPGGVGPMTVTALFENILDLCEL